MERKSAIKNKPVPGFKHPAMKIASSEKAARIKGEGGINPFLLREKKNRKRVVGGHVLNEIRKLQDNTDYLLPRAPFQRLVKEICQDNFEEEIRWTTLSMQALQTSAEEYMVGLFEDSYLCSMHCKRVTLLSQDLQLARRIRGLSDPGNR